MYLVTVPFKESLERGRRFVMHPISLKALLILPLQVYEGRTHEDSPAHLQCGGGGHQRHQEPVWWGPLWPLLQLTVTI